MPTSRSKEGHIMNEYDDNFTEIEISQKVLRSNRKFGKALVKAVDNELMKCNPHVTLTLEIRIVEHQDKPIVEVTNKRRWKKFTGGLK